MPLIQKRMLPTISASQFNPCLDLLRKNVLAQDVPEQLTPASLALALDALEREILLERQGQADPQKTLIIELEYCHKDGYTHYLQNILGGIRDYKGTLIGIHGVSRDITRRKKAENAPTLFLPPPKKTLQFCFHEPVILCLELY